MLGHHRPASSADDDPFIAVFGSSIPLSTKKTTTKFFYQILTPSDKTFWIRAWKWNRLFKFTFGILIQKMAQRKSLQINIYISTASLNEPLNLRCGSYLHKHIDLSHTHICVI